MHTFTSAASFVLSATLSRPTTTFSIKVASELNTPILSIPSTYPSLCIYIRRCVYAHTYIHLSTTTYVLMRVRISRRKKKRTDPFTFIAIDPVYIYICVCMYGRSSLLSSLFFLRNRLEQTDKRLLSPTPLYWMLLTLEEQHSSDSWSSTENVLFSHL